MSHDHHHHDGDAGLHPVVDPSLPDGELAPGDLTRRRFLGGIGVITTGFAATSVTGGLLGQQLASAATLSAASDQPGNYQWLSGDHHIHTQYSVDGQYRVAQHVAQARSNGLDWMVVTDHGRDAHEKVSIDMTLADVVQARQSNPSTLVFQGVEWNIPGGEHGTVFFSPGAEEAALLHEFEQSYDGVIIFGSAATAASSEPLAVEAVKWIANQVANRRTEVGLFLANHPSRRGLDSPHEFRAWNDAGPAIAVGMEGAPGHQAAAIAKSVGGPEVARGYYDFNPVADSFAGYPLESYRTFGGFDWITAKVGGLWDALLAEGRRYWITANSDSHSVYLDTYVRGSKPDGTPVTSKDYDDPTSPYYGRYPDPVNTGVAQSGRGDFWPGYYSRTWVGAATRSYADVMRGISAGRVWVCHGDLISGLAVTASSSVSSATLGGTVAAARGDSVTVQMVIRPTTRPNAHGDTPVLSRVDVIAGPVTGPAADRDGFTAPYASVVRSFDVAPSSSDIVLTQTFRNVTNSFYVRLRGTDGNFSAPGSIEPRLDPVPVDPWTDLWFYSNPVFVAVS